MSMLSSKECGAEIQNNSAYIMYGVGHPIAAESSSVAPKASNTGSSFGLLSPVNVLEKPLKHIMKFEMDSLFNSKFRQKVFWSQTNLK